MEQNVSHGLERNLQGLHWQWTKSFPNLFDESKCLSYILYQLVSSLMLEIFIDAI